MFLPLQTLREFGAVSNIQTLYGNKTFSHNIISECKYKNVIGTPGNFPILILMYFFQLPAASLSCLETHCLDTP